MAIVIVGALMGTCMLVGSLLAQVPAVAVPAIFGLCVGAWPTRPAPEPHAHGAAGGRAMLGYGVLLGLAGAAAAAAGFLLHLDHVGWVCGAALMVMRPNRGLLRLRGVDRVWSVLAGAAAGGALVLARPPTAVLVSAVVVALAALAAT